MSRMVPLATRDLATRDEEAASDDEQAMLAFGGVANLPTINNCPR